MKKLLSVLLLLNLAFSLFSCDKEGRVVDKANELIEDGKIKEAYELLFENKNYPIAKEMLENFTVSAGRTTNKNYSPYNAITETTYNEQGDVVTTYRNYTYMIDHYEVMITNTNTYENGKLVKCVTIDDESNDVEETLYSYDNNGNLIMKQISNFYDNATEPSFTSKDVWEYDENGNVIKAEEYLDGVLQYSYTYTYDAKGNKTKETILNFKDKITENTYFYNDIDQLIKEVNVTENSTTTKEYTYNDHSDVIKLKITQEYLFEGNTEPTVTTIETMSEYEYDQNGNITKKTNSGLSATVISEEMSYNDRGDVVKHLKVYYDKTSSLTETEYEYFENGNIKKQKTVQNSWGGSELLSEFDSRGNLIKESSGDSKNTYEYTYDANGNITKKKEIKLDGTPKYYEYTYNEKNELIKELCYYEGDENKPVYNEYTYNESGLLVEEKTNENEFTETYKYTYNDHGDLISKDSVSQGVAFTGDRYEYTYSENDKMLTKKDYNSEGELKQLHEYDENGNEIRLTYYTDGKEGRWHEKEFDENGNIVKFTSIGLDKNGEKEISFVETYTYSDYGLLLQMLREGYMYGVYATQTEYFDYEYYYN